MANTELTLFPLKMISLLCDPILTYGTTVYLVFYSTSWSINFIFSALTLHTWLSTGNVDGEMAPVVTGD